MTFHYIGFTLSLLAAILTTIVFVSTVFLIPITYSVILFVVWIISLICLGANVKDLLKELNRQ